MDFFIGFAIGAWVTHMLFKVVIRAHMSEHAKALEAADLDLSALDDLEPPKVPVRVEQYDEIFYLFDTDTETFVAQGRNLKEINEHIDQTPYRYKQVMLSDGEEEIVNRLKATAEPA